MSKGGSILMSVKENTRFIAADSFIANEKGLCNILYPLSFSKHIPFPLSLTSSISSPAFFFKLILLLESDYYYRYHILQVSGQVNPLCLERPHHILSCGSKNI